MPSTTHALARRVFRQLHLWFGLGLGVLLVPIALSGAVLIFDDKIDALLNPGLHAVTGSKLGAPVDQYLEQATDAVPGGTASAVRFTVGGPVIVVVRPAEGGTREARQDRHQMQSEAGSRERSQPDEGVSRNGPPRFEMVYLDPPTAKVLGVAAFGDSLIGFVHRFHENLLIPQWAGRSIVGWIGAAMLLLCLTGVWIWWPRNAAFLRGLRWRRGPSVNDNLHHIFGFWIALPLGFMSLTGMYLSFPSQGRALIASMATMAPPQERGFGQTLAHPALTAQQAFDAGLATAGNGQPRSLSLPNRQTHAWQLQFVNEHDEQRSVSIDDVSGQAILRPAPQSGDVFASWLRRVHEGAHHGPIWRLIALLTGLLPTQFLITGVSIWLRKKRHEKRMNVIKSARILSPQPSPQEHAAG